MEVNDKIRRQLQSLMEDPRWGAVEMFLHDFMDRNFIQGSIKRGSEFDTIWYAAEAEGGKRTILQFFKSMEEEAKNVDTQ